MKKLLLVIALIPLLCCCNNGEKSDGSSENSSVSVAESEEGQSTNPDSQRIAALYDEVQGLIQQYGNDDDTAHLYRALSLTDSIASLDTTKEGRFNVTLNKANLYATMGKMHEAMRLQESLLSADPNDVTRLQFYAGKYQMEGKLDSANIYVERAIAAYDHILNDSAIDASTADDVMLNKIAVLQIVNDRSRAKDVFDQYAAKHEGITEKDFNSFYDNGREAFNRSSVAYRNEEQSAPAKSPKK